MKDEGFDNVEVLQGDGTLGWPDHAPYDAISVTAGGPDAPRALLEQLKIGGRLVIPLGSDRDLQTLVRITRVGESDYRREELGDVRFVPLVGAQGWKDGEAGASVLVWPRPATRPALVSNLIREMAEPFGEIQEADFAAMADRIGGAHLVLVGEATHGTSEFYRIRAEITRHLIAERGFKFVAVEADWPDAACIDRFVRGTDADGQRDWEAFSRFPTWMWRNQEVFEFIDWLRTFNQQFENARERVGFFGLDLYSMYTSIHAVLDYLDSIDPEAARNARLRYGCLTPWERDPALYGRLAVGGRIRACEAEVVATLKDLLQRRLQYSDYDGARFFDAVQNARLVANAEHYYRAMYYGGNESWNLRDQHMFDTLEILLGYHGGGSKAVVWEHNSHLGDAAATEMGAGGQTNVGHLCRDRFGQAAYLIGQGTDHGTVAAAANWDESVDFMHVRPAYPGSFESLFHESGVKAFLLPFRKPRKSDVREELAASRLERAIGVVYRPDTELASHYFHAQLSRQFDEFIWVDQSHSLHPVTPAEARRLAPDHPFAIR